MRNFLDNAERPAEQLGCLVLVIHHEGNETGRPRGHTALPAGVVAQWQLKRHGMHCRLTCERAKDGLEGQIFDFTLKPIELKPVELGDDDPEDDYRETTLMVDKIEPVGAAAKSKGPLWQRATEILARTLSERPEISLGELREALERSGVIDGRSPERRRGQWFDIKKALVDRGLAFIDGDRIAFVSKTPNA
jgi:hypothetical protein